MNCQKCRQQLDLLKAYTSWLKQAVVRGTDSRDFKEAYDVLAEAREKVSNLEQNLWVSVERAREILGEENVFAAAAIEAAFGFRPEKTPHIPFSEELLRRAQELGMFLVLRVDQSNKGEELTVAKITNLIQQRQEKMQQEGQLTDHKLIEPYIARSAAKDIKIRPGWALVSKRLLEDLARKNYPTQTKYIIDWVEKQFFKNQRLPKIIKQEVIKREIDNFDRLVIAAFVSENQDRNQNDTTFDQLINELFRPNPAELLHDIFIYYFNTYHQWLFQRAHAWTNFINPQNPQEAMWIGGTGSKLGVNAGLSHINMSGYDAVISYRHLK